MPERGSELKIAGNYRVNQPIDNFRLRVRVVQQKSLLAELFECDETTDSNFLEAEDRIFQWQEKVFSPYEAEFYADEKNCHSAIQKRYHEDITSENFPGSSRLFSYTSEDTFIQEKTALTGSNYRSELSERNDTALPTIRNRKPFTQRHNKRVLDSWPTDTRTRVNHYLYKKTKIMYIMADLSSKDAPNDTASETLLCTLVFDEARKLLTVDPDFSGSCYTVESLGMTYDYWIEHASAQPSAPQAQLSQQLSSQHEGLRELSVPSSNVLRVFLTLDLLEARDFPYDALFLTYLIDLPMSWSTPHAERLSGRTQRCRMVRGRAHFAFVIDVTLDLDLNCRDGTWPRLLLAAASLDAWTRYRIEGYVSVPLPPTSGSQILVLKTWRPVTGFVNSLRRFFTGGTAELDDLTYCGVPRDSGSSLDKARLKVVPAGEIVVRIGAIHQTKSTKNREVSTRRAAGIVLSSVDEVLRQFKAARERMIQARRLVSSPAMS